MAIPLFEDDIAFISKLSDNPNSGDGLSAAQLKARFDAAALAIQKYINEILIPEMDMTIDVKALLNGILDATLSAPDKAAQAKAVGDAIAKLEDAIKNIEPGASEEQIAQIQKNADAIAALPITVTEDGFTEITGLPEVTAVHTVQEGNVYTMTLSLDDGSVSTNVITVENGLPSKVVVDGVEIPFTWELDDTEDDGEAEDTVIYLYKNGDACEDVTGGWSDVEWDYSGASNAAVLNVDDNAMSLTLAGSYSGDGGYATNNAIDLTSKNTITITCDVNIATTGSYFPGDEGAAFYLVCGKNTASAPEASVEINRDVANATGQEITLDVSGLSGEYYIGLKTHFYDAEHYVTMMLTVHELRVE